MLVIIIKRHALLGICVNKLSEYIMAREVMMIEIIGAKKDLSLLVRCFMIYLEDVSVISAEHLVTV